MRIDIWSDVVCPWCYLGARRLGAAIDKVGHDDIEVRWRAFQLDPRHRGEPRELRPVLEAKYGPGSFDGMTARLTALGAADGIDYRFDTALSINTFDAHRLIAWAATDLNAQSALVERLFHGYFSRGEDLSSREVLLGVVDELAADGATLDHDTAAGLLDSAQFGDEVHADIAMARELGITGVPAFVIDHEFLVPGAQVVDRLVQLIEKVRTRDLSA